MLGVGVLVMLVVFGLWWTIIQWYECRQMGFSILYCLKHIS